VEILCVYVSNFLGKIRAECKNGKMQLNLIWQKNWSLTVSFNALNKEEKQKNWSSMVNLRYFKKK
jgi:hypothetical protein